MRIGMMVDVYKPHISGITNYISLNKKFLEQLGHEVFVFTFGNEDYPDDETNIIRSPGMPLLNTGYYVSLNYSRQARSLIRTMDVVHVHHPFLSGSLALRYCRPRGIPVIFTNHTRYDLYTRAYLPVLPDVIGETAMEAYLPVFCRSCDLVISPSPGMRDVLRHFGVDVPIEVVPNGVDLQPFRKPDAVQKREDLGFSPETVLLIYVGRLGPEKNVPFLLRSFAGAAQAYDHIGLLLVGDGPERDNLEDRVQYMKLTDTVKFTGLVPYEQLPSYMAISDAFVTASVTEVHPLTVIEAMAAGLPVLGIDSPGVGDTVEDNVTGYLAPEEDLASFTAKMVRLITDHENRKRMAQQASEQVDRYAIENTVLQVLAQYNQVVQKTASERRAWRSRMMRVWDSWVN
jgi:glycosyltransferase involved in cell wall biosynthesis